MYFPRLTVVNVPSPGGGGELVSVLGGEPVPGFTTELSSKKTDKMGLTVRHNRHTEKTILYKH